MPTWPTTSQLMLVFASKAITNGAFGSQSASSRLLSSIRPTISSASFDVFGAVYQLTLSRMEP